MLRIAFAFALLALLGQATGFFAYAGGGTSCSQLCPDDDQEGRCPPDCACCTCCAHVQPVTVIAPVAGLFTPSSPIRFHEHGSIPASVDQRDIFHVPKFVLA